MTRCERRSGTCRTGVRSQVSNAFRPLPRPDRVDGPLLTAARLDRRQHAQTTVAWSSYRPVSYKLVPHPDRSAGTQIVSAS